MNILYYAYSLDLDKHLGTFNPSDYEGDRTGQNFKQWCASFNEPVVSFVYWEDEWFQAIENSVHMSKVSVISLPKDIQMRLLIGAMP